MAKKHKLMIGPRSAAAAHDRCRIVVLPTAESRKYSRVADRAEPSPGEMVKWDTSEHDWLEGRGEKLYLIHMIDDATSELTN